MKKWVLTLITAALVCSCGIYSFSGTSIQPDVTTVSIDLFEYKALKVNPTLSNDLTEGLKTKFRQMTRLEQVEENADLEIFGEVTGYSISASSITADEGFIHQQEISGRRLFGQSFLRIRGIRLQPDIRVG